MIPKLGGGPADVLVIGASACGAKAASRVKRLNPNARVVMLDQRRRVSFAACGLPYYVQGAVRELAALYKTAAGTARDEAYFKNVAGVELRTGMRVEAIDRKAKTVVARNVDTGTEETFAYGKLVLALGALPVKPPIPGVDLKNVHHLTTLEDAEALAAILDGRPEGAAVVIGAGFIGVEAAEALAARKWQVTLLEREGQVFPRVLDFELAALVQDHLIERMVDVRTGVTVLRFEGENGAVKRVATAEGAHKADLVVLATGILPNAALAVQAGLAIGETGALAVNARMQTSDPDIYAGGDMAENTHLVTGGKCYAPLGSTANKHGRVIANNICGGAEEFPGILGTWVCKAFHYTAAVTGLTEAAAQAAGLDFYPVLTTGPDKAHYYPGGQPLVLKMIVEKKTERLLGLQAVGGGDAARRIDVAATAIRFGATLGQVANLDLAYAPPYSQALDVVIAAANAARNAGAGILKRVSSADARRMIASDDGVIVLDVRSPAELQRMRIDSPKVVNIPLGQLRARAGELPKDKKILCLCQQGPRSFMAQRILEGAGFEDVHTIEGGLFAWPWKDELA